MNYYIKCKYTSSKQGCTHKTIAKWYLSETCPSFIAANPLHETELDDQPTSDISKRLEEEINLREDMFNISNKHEAIETPPANSIENDYIKNMTSYFLEKKQIPYNLPESVLDANLSENMSISPNESNCPICPTSPLLQKAIVKNKTAKIYTTKKIIENVKIFVKICPDCQAEVIPQDYRSGLLNYNNNILISLEFLVLLRNALLEHTAISRTVSIIEMTNRVKFDKDHIIKAYFMFDALSHKELSFNCDICGFHPVLLTFDTNRKAVFNVEDDIYNMDDDVECDDGRISIQDFWDQIFKYSIAEGVKGRCKNPFLFKPSAKYSAPWLPVECRNLNGAVNTEHLKGRSSVSHDEVDMVNSLSEERLEELLAKGSKKELDAICKDCGIEVQLNTKIDCIKALKSAIASSAHIDKFFVKICMLQEEPRNSFCYLPSWHCIHDERSVQGRKHKGHCRSSFKHEAPSQHCHFRCPTYVGSTHQQTSS